MVIAYMFLQRSFMAGMVAGAVKWSINQELPNSSGAGGSLVHQALLFCAFVPLPKDCSCSFHSRSVRISRSPVWP